MGTPDMTLEESIVFMAGLGHQGIEVRLSKDSPLHPANVVPGATQNFRKLAFREGIRFACLTPYENGYSPSESPATVAGLKRVAEIACELECPSIRVLPGIYSPEATSEEQNIAWEQLCDGIASVASHAAPLGVSLLIENHGGTLANNSRKVEALINEIGRENVGMLFDIVWERLACGNSVLPLERMKLIRHIHLKDCRVLSCDPPRIEPALYGEGEMPIEELLREAIRSGYTGYICDEYEKFWYPDHLPEASEGMKYNLKFLRNYLS